MKKNLSIFDGLSPTTRDASEKRRDNVNGPTTRGYTRGDCYRFPLMGTKKNKKLYGCGFFTILRYLWQRTCGDIWKDAKLPVGRAEQLNNSARQLDEPRTVWAIKLMMQGHWKWAWPKPRLLIPPKKQLWRPATPNNDAVDFGHSGGRWPVGPAHLIPIPVSGSCFITIVGASLSAQTVKYICYKHSVRLQ